MFFITKKPNLKKNIFFVCMGVLEGEGARVSEFFLL